MRVSICRKQVRRGAAAAVLLLAGCASASSHRPVREFREFPEYGGFLPVDVDGDVLPQLVVPVRAADGSENWTLPASAEEARQRLERSDAGERMDPVLAGVGAAALYPLALGALFLGYAFGGNSEKELARFLEEHGVPVELRVSDPDGRPIAGARVRECPASITLPSYSPSSGRRSLRPVGQRTWTPGATLLHELARHLPVPLGREIEVEERNDNQIVETRYELGERDRFSQAVGGDEGLVRYVSLAASPAGSLASAPGLGRADAQASAGLHLLVWAPGFEPTVVSAGSITPRVALHLDATLQPAADGARVREACARLRTAVDAVPGAVDVKLLSASVDGEPLIAALRAAQEIAQDASLPGWLCWNAREILADLAAAVPELTRQHSGNILGKKGSRKEADEEAERSEKLLEQLPDRGSPWLADDDANPWTLDEALERWIGAAMRAGIDPAPEGPRHATQGQLLAEARGLLARGEAIDPTFPGLEPLRAALALAAGDRTAALEHAWLLDSGQYFRLFYGALRASAGG